LAELAELINKKDKARILRKRAETMTDRINKVGWDGNWYLRGFTDDDFAYGSSRNKKGKIFLNSQSWAILSGVADKERQGKLIKSVDKYLDGKHGPALFYPAYSEFDGRLGRMTMFSEGTKENAAVFCHAVLFKVVADCMLKRGNRAFDSISKIMPNKQSDCEKYKTEPYVFAEYLIGPGHPYRYGEGAFTWITGTAGWAHAAAIEWILGIRKDYEGLVIDPCIPSRWKSFKVRRPYWAAVYEIEVHNPAGKESGVKEIFVDGKRQTENLIKSHRDGKLHKVKVVMG
jgi:cellobiose phosphorylase